MIYILALVAFLSAIPTSLVIPMLPFLGREYGATPFEVSMLYALMPMTLVICSPFWGRASDRFGRKPLYVAGVGGGAIAMTLFGLADNFSALIAIRVLQGVAASNITIAIAMASDLSTDRNRAGNMGLVIGAMSLAFVLGPLVGGISQGHETAFDHATPAFIGAGLGALATLLAATGLRETRQLRPSGAGSPRFSSAPASSLTGSTRAALLFLLPIVGGFSSGATQFAFTYWASGSGWTIGDVAFGISLMGIGYAISMFLLVGPLSRRLGDDHTVLCGLGVELLGIALFLTGSFAGMVGCAVLAIACVGNGVWTTALSSALVRRVGAQASGSVVGTANGLAMLGRVIGPLSVGVTIIASPRWPFVVNLALLGVGLAIAAPILAWRRRSDMPLPDSGGLE